MEHTSLSTYQEVIYDDIAVIAEDQLMLRKAMVQLIEMHEDIKVLANLENGVDALKFIKITNPMWLF